MAQGKISGPAVAAIVVVVVVLIGIVGYRAMNKEATPPSAAQTDAMRQRGGGTSVQH
ncbi:hypothetical protein IAD21_00526 [Abditibacteriota bacterium]|nr:hypothetical protein IAD21_00526 [Abditibacteriota bacterium]